MKKYLLGIANMNDFVDFIGWDNDSDWYETVNNIEEDDGEFISGYEDDIIIYQYDTKEEAEKKRIDIQKEFDLVIFVYEVTKNEDDGCWYVSNIWKRKELNMKVYVVWTQFQDDAFAVEIDKAFFNKKDAERYVKEKVDELNHNGYVAYLPDDLESDDDDNARVWIEEVEVEGRPICGQ